MRRIKYLELKIRELFASRIDDSEFVNKNLVALAKNIDEVKKSKAEAKEIERLEDLIVNLTTHVSRLENPPKFKNGDEVEFDEPQSMFRIFYGGAAVQSPVIKKHGTIISHYYYDDGSIYPTYKVLSDDHKEVSDHVERCLTLYEKKPVKK